MAWNADKASAALNKWFTPQTPAVANYVDRGKLDKTIYQAFAEQGSQVLVYGPTGAGKTSMVLDNLKKLEKQYGTKYVKVSMTNDITIDKFIGSVAQKLHLTRRMQQVNTKL